MVVNECSVSIQSHGLSEAAAECETPLPGTKHKHHPYRVVFMFIVKKRGVEGFGSESGPSGA